MPQGTGLWISCVESPKPFHVSAPDDYAISINLGPAYHIDSRLSGEKSAAQLGSGGLYMVAAGCDLRTAFRGLASYHLLSFSCSRAQFEQTALRAGLAFPSHGLPPAWSTQSDPQMVAIAQAVVAELQSAHCSSMLLETLTLALSLHTLRRATGTAIAMPAPVKGLAPYVLRRVIDHIHDHVAEKLSLEALANIAGLSTWHFCRMFKQSTGMPPHQYLAQVRIERARELLLHTPLPIGDIAFGTGFDSPSRFSQFFRQHMRCTPQEYRRQRAA
jgi:AraC family transcriptional regulator